MEYLRPIRSAIGAATSAPINVPIESYYILVTQSLLKDTSDAYHGNYKSSPDITKVETPILVYLSKALQEVLHAKEPGNLTFTA